MQILSPNTKYTATARFPVKPAGLTCTAKLWLSKDGVSQDASSTVPFTSTGIEQSLSLPVVMPAGGYSYQVLLDVSVDGVQIGAYEGEPVIIPWVGVPEIVWWL